MKTVRALARGAVVVSAIVGAAGSAFAQSGDVNVYTYRESKLIQPLFDAFSRDTGIKVNVISASSGLEQRIKAEGANSPADVLLTVDIGRIEAPCGPASPNPSSPTYSIRSWRPNIAIPRGTGTAFLCARAWSTPRRIA